MNITEQIAEIILKGQTVELPGIGTLAARQVEAHFDAASNTFFPTRQEIVFNPGMRGGFDMVSFIAEKECVSNATAMQMWRNYADALAGKFEKAGVHEIPGVGTLTKTETGYTFEGVAVAGTNPALTPVSELKTYSHTDDPFAAYTAAPAPAPEPEVAPAVEEPAPEPMPTAVLVAEAEAEAEEVAAEEEAPVEPEPAPEPELEPEPEPEPAPVVVSEEEMAPVEEAPAPAAEEAEEEEVDPLQSLADMQQQPTPESFEKNEKKKKKGGKLWIVLIVLLLLLAGGAAAWYFLLRDKEESKGAIDSNRLEEMVSGSEGTNADAEEMDPYGDSTETDVMTENEEESDMEEATADEETAAEVADAQTEDADEPEEKSELQKKYLPFTLNDDMFEYESGEIDYLADEIGRYMADYVAEYAKAERYGKAVEKLQERVAQYANERMTELLAPNNASASQFLPSKDYIRECITPSLRARKASHKRHEVQKELMDRGVLGRLLNEVVEANGIEQDAAAAAPAAAKDKPVKLGANYRSSSKAGFDVIAGFFTVKSNADKLATQLKRQGCDAYVIEINHGYYVSMGSKSSRTEVERLYQHLKEWYTGDMAIKQF